MAISDKRTLRRKIKIDMENGLTDSEISAKYNVPGGKVKKIRKIRPKLCEDKDFRKYEIIRDFKCLSEFEIGEINHTDLINVFCNASKIITRDGKGKRYRNLIYPLKPREWELRHAICDVLSKLEFNYLIECPIKNPEGVSKKQRPLWTDIAILTKKGIVDIELKDARSLSGIRQDFRKLLSAPFSTIGTACFYLFNDKNFDDNKLSDILSDYVRAYESELKNLEKLGIKIYEKWFLFFLFAFDERMIFSCFFKNIKEVGSEWINKSEFHFGD
jgi:hypothetical protein